MNRRLVLSAIAVAALAAAPALAQSEHAAHAAMEMGQAQGGHSMAGMDNKTLPPSEDTAKDRLNTSPRHGEWVKVDSPDGPINTWIVYPERKTKAPVVLVIHEIFGESDWIRGVADQLAAEGFIAVAPDLLSGKGPNGGGTEAYPSRDEVTKAVSGLPRDVVNTRLDAVRSWAIKLPASTGKSGTVGFCWGGTSSFAYAVHQPALTAAVVYYGTAPEDKSTLTSVKAPVIGFYGGADMRVDATIPATEAKMKELKKVYEPNVFDGAGHGFLRAQSGQTGANMKATEQAWPKTIAFLRKYLESGKGAKTE